MKSMSDGMEQVNDNGRVLMMWRNVCKELLPFLLCLQLITFTHFLLSPQHNAIFYLELKIILELSINEIPLLIDQSAAFYLLVDKKIWCWRRVHVGSDMLHQYDLCPVGLDMNPNKSEVFVVWKKLIWRSPGMLSIELCVLWTEKCLGLWL